MTFDFIIIGSGLAGYNLVKEFRRLNNDASILMITSDDGRYYSKPMLSTGFAKSKSAAELAMKSADQMAEAFNITIYCLTSVTSIDKTAQSVIVNNQPDAQRYQQSLIFATGAAPVQIPFPPALDQRCFPINDLQDYDHFRRQLADRKHVTIIGAGLVGTEYANDLAVAGVKVNVIALDDRPLQQLLPQPLSEAVQQQLAEQGINWHFNTSIADAKYLAEQQKLALTLGNGKVITTDLVLSAVGLKPRTELAAQSGLTINRGIVVDQSLKTSDDNIYAFGDCAEIVDQILMYVAPLTLCAKALAKTLNGEKTEVKIPATPVIVKTPFCPVVSSLPHHGEQGSWVYEGEAPDLKATFVDTDNNLFGFALTGKKVMERMKLAKQLPAIL